MAPPDWSHVLTALNEERIADAETSLRAALGVEHLRGQRFLDAGSGSGLYSLAARRLGARVHSFDQDAGSVACTRELKRRYFPDDTSWAIEQASVLDRHYLAGLGDFGFVYSWGVLHYTGSMWEALANVSERVAPGGKLCVAVYNHQGWRTRYWKHIKEWYARTAIHRAWILLLHAPYMWGVRRLARSLPGRNPRERGLSLWQHMLAVLNGFPFEAAYPEDVVKAQWKRGFILTNVRLCGNRHACNEFLFARPGPGEDGTS